MLERRIDLVLIPGINNTSDLWAPVVASLPRWVRGHALDLPRLDTVAQIAAQYLNELPERFFLLGFSFGGYVAIEMASQAPERIRGLILVNTTAGADSDAQRQFRRKAIDAAKRGGYESLVSSFSAKVFHPANLANPALMRARQAMNRDYGAGRFVVHQRACMARPDRRERLSGLDIPTLVIAAADDQVASESEQRQMAESLVSGSYELIPDAGHMMPMEKPEELADRISAWLRGIGSQARVERG